MKQVELSTRYFQQFSLLLQQLILKLYLAITVLHKTIITFFARLLTAAIAAMTILVIAPSTAYAQDKPIVSVQSADTPSDIVITKTYLLESPKGVTTPHLIVKQYDASKGLLAGYQAENGKRILFRARNRLGLGVVAQVLHYDASTRKIHNLMGRSRTVDEKGNAIKDVQVGGIDLMMLLKSAKQKSSDHAIREGQAKKFLATEEGAALIEAIPALYAALDDLNDDHEVQQLKQAFGAIAMGLQLGTKQFASMKNAEQIHGATKFKKMKDACNLEKECAFRGKSFTVYQSGLFDVLSKSFIKKTKSINEEFPSAISSSNSALISQLTGDAKKNITKSIQFKNGDGNCDAPGPCFGYCGLGCLTPGMVATIECAGHDLCVCKFSHAACFSSVPIGCDGAAMACYSLIDAAESFLGATWEELVDLWDWIVSWFEGDDDDPCDPDPLSENPVQCQGG